LRYHETVQSARERARGVATLLGLGEILIVPLGVFNETVMFGVRINTTALKQREQVGPRCEVLDHDTLTMWEWSENDASPPSPVEIAAILIPAVDPIASTLSRALRWSLIATPVIVSQARCSNDDCLTLECALRGYGLIHQAISGESSEILIHPSEAGYATTRSNRHLTHRWLEELIYGTLRANSNLLRTAGAPENWPTKPQ
jgi:hypothetical protein